MDDQYKEEEEFRKQRNGSSSVECQRICEDEKEAFEINMKSAMENFSSNPILSVSYLINIVSLIEHNENIVSLLDNSGITPFLCAVCCSVGAENIVPPLILLADSLIENERENDHHIVEQCSETEILGAIMHVISESEHSVQIVSPAYEILSSIIKEDRDSHKPFFEMDGVHVIMRHLAEYEDKSIKESIGIIVYSLIEPDFICACDSEDSETKTSITEEAIHDIADIFSILLGSSVYNPAFGILHRIIDIAFDEKHSLNGQFMELFNVLVEDGTCDLIFSTASVLISTQNEIIQQYTAQQGVCHYYEEPVDITKKKQYVRSGLLLIKELVEKMPEENVKNEFCLDEIITITFTNQSECPIIQDFSSLALACLASFISKSSQCANIIFASTFISKFVDAWGYITFEQKSEFIDMLLDMFCMIPSTNYGMIDQEIWEIVFDFVDEENAHAIRKLAYTIKTMTDKRYKLINFEPFLEQISSLEYEIGEGDEMVEFFSILTEMIEDAIEEEDEGD